jgi:hypothetical protein
MDSETKEHVFLVLTDLFKYATFVSFEDMQQETGLSYDQLIEFKPDLEERLQGGDKSITLTPLLNLSKPGFFLDTN